jgi:hypothetical protein
MPNQTAQGMIRAMLHEWGLDGLANWAWQRFKETNSMDVVKLEMEDRPEYKARFAGRLARVAQGFEMTEAEQLGYENSASALMQQAGMPPGFYDNWHDFTNLIAGGVSIAELGQRVNDAYMTVAQAPPQVRQAMYEYYGVRGDAALAAMALDAKKAAPAIMNQVGAAEVGGYLAQQHVKVTRDIAEMATQAVDNQQSAIKSASQQVGQWQSQTEFNKRFGEAGVDVNTGVNAAFMGDQVAAEKISKQQQQRAASMQGGEHFDPNRFGAGGLGEAQH